MGIFFKRSELSHQEISRLTLSTPFCASNLFSVLWYDSVVSCYFLVV